MNLLTFLGTGNYTETAYSLEKETFSTPYIQEALALCMQKRPDRVYVMLTVQARERHWSKLSNRLAGHGIECVGIDIPSGQTEGELWELFDITVKTLDKGEWALDITHAFRFIPLFAYMAAVYTSAMQNIQLSAIYYGAFESKDENGVAPVYDLSLLLDLNEWLQGAQALIKTGNSSVLANLLTESQRKAYQSQAGGKNTIDLPTRLSSVGNALHQVNAAFQNAQANGYRSAVVELKKRLGSAEDQIEVWAKPFFRILEKVLQSYSVVEDNVLLSELQLIKTYAKNGMVIQGVQLLNEWLINFAVYKLELDKDDEYLHDPEKRGKLMSDLSSFTRKSKNEQPIAEWDVLENFHESYPDYFKMMAELPRLRNDLAHCGYRKGATPAHKFEKQFCGMADRAESICFLSR
jgi:CRISPR-associated DxTHG motif protein